MENRYSELIKDLIREMLAEELDMLVYNIPSLINKVTESYMKEHIFQEFKEDVEENVANILYDKYKIDLS